MLFIPFIASVQIHKQAIISKLFLNFSKKIETSIVIPYKADQPTPEQITTCERSLMIIDSPRAVTFRHFTQYDCNRGRKKNNRAGSRVSCSSIVGNGFNVFADCGRPALKPGHCLSRERRKSDCINQTRMGKKGRIGEGAAAPPRSQWGSLSEPWVDGPSGALVHCAEKRSDDRWSVSSSG